MIKTVTALLVLCLSVAAVQASDIEKRWRLGLSVGGSDARDGVPSDSANVLTITDEDDIPQNFFVDPRNDNAAIGTLSIKPALVGTFTAQYAATKMFVIEMSAGYSRSEIGDIEVQAQFDRDPIDPDAVNPFKFRAYRVTAGDLTQIPLQITALSRFRPRANLNPYVGVGLGYTIVGFEPSDDYNQLSSNILNSAGVFARLQTFPGSFAVGSGQAVAFSGATIEAEDTFEWHAVGGLEMGVGKSWAVVFDLRWMFSSRSIKLKFNDQEQMGIPVPNKRVMRDAPEVTEPYGAIAVSQGGIIDGGRLVPTDPDATDVDCDVTPTECTFITEPDGIADPGFYYVQGGEIRYDAIQVSIGFRYTF